MQPHTPSTTARRSTKTGGGWRSGRRVGGGKWPADAQRAASTHPFIVGFLACCRSCAVEKEQPRCLPGPLPKCWGRGVSQGANPGEPLACPTVKRHRGEPGHTRAHGSHRRTSQPSQPTNAPERPRDDRISGRLNGGPQPRSRPLPAPTRRPPPANPTQPPPAPPGGAGHTHTPDPGTHTSPQTTARTSHTLSSSVVVTVIHRFKNTGREHSPGTKLRNVIRPTGTSSCANTRISGKNVCSMIALNRLWSDSVQRLYLPIFS